MKGIWYHWLVATVILFVIIIFYQTMTPAINLVVNTLDNTSFNVTGVNTSWHVTTGRVQTMWNWWPVISMVILILIVFYISTREEYDTGYIERGY